MIPQAVYFIILHHDKVGDCPLQIQYFWDYPRDEQVIERDFVVSGWFLNRNRLGDLYVEFDGQKHRCLRFPCDLASRHPDLPKDDPAGFECRIPVSGPARVLAIQLVFVPSEGQETVVEQRSIHYIGEDEAERQPPPVTIFVLGMHRSGTSAMAGLLHTAGIHLGDVFIPPLPQNPKGNFEDFLTLQVNEYLLSCIGKSWFQPPTLEDLSKVPKRYFTLIPQTYLHFRSRFRLWAWKDPRHCLTFPLWAELLPRSTFRLICICRNPVSVARSLNTRDGLPMNAGLRLWKEYNSRILATIERYNIPFTFLRYETVLEDPEAAQKLIERDLKMDLNEGWRFVDKRLNRSGSPEANLPPEIQQVYDKVLRLCDRNKNTV